MTHKEKIDAALTLLAGCPQHVFAELAVLAADQAGLDADDQDWLRKSLACRVCGEAETMDRSLCLECEERDHNAQRAKRDRAKMRAPKGENEDGHDGWRGDL